MRYEISYELSRAAVVAYLLFEIISGYGKILVYVIASFNIFIILNAPPVFNITYEKRNYNSSAINVLHTVRCISIHRGFSVS